MVLRAMKSIDLGEEITTSFITDLALNKTQRQNKLKEYSIDCKCEKCELNLDSEVDYELYHKLKEQLFSSKTVDDWDVFESSSAQFISIAKSIYGEYSPINSWVLITILGFHFKKSNPNHDLISKLIQTLNHSIKITHGVNHPIYMGFVLALITYCEVYKIQL